MKQFTELEKEALRAAMLITSYSPNSFLANVSPGFYALLFHQARRIMQEAGVEPDANIRCWFWQIDAIYHSGNDPKGVEQEMEQSRRQPSPTLDEHGMWVGPDGKYLSDRDFVRLYPN